MKAARPRARTRHNPNPNPNPDPNPNPNPNPNLSEARTRHNTFREQLEQLASGPRGFADHTSLDIRDGGNDPCDDKRL